MRSYKGMIVGLFNDSFPPIMDGVAIAVKNYAYYINKKYGKAYVITPSFPGYKDEEEYEVIRYFSIPVILRPPYRFGVPFLDIKVVKKIESIPFDIIHVHSPFSSGILGLYIARKKKIPIVASFHTKYYDDFKEATKSDFLAKIGVKIIVEFYHRVDEVWTVNSATAKTLKEYGFKKDVKIVPNGTDFFPLENLGDYKNKINRIHNLSEEDTVILFVGQMVRQKNVELLLRSLSILKEDNVNFKAIFVGTGKDEDYFKRLAEELKIKDKVIFTGKIFDRELLKAYYARANLLAFPSLYDTSALVIKEASAMGCPSLLIKGSTVAEGEGVIDGFNGFLSENDHITYARKMKEILSQKEFLKKVGENARKTLYKHWEEIVDEVVGNYRELIEKYKKEY
jgi:glycosyltransferase involved in cell wall biosynthesis